MDTPIKIFVFGGPLEQFQTWVLYTVTLGSNKIYLTNTLSFILLAVISIKFVMSLSVYKGTYLAKVLTSIMTEIYNFVLGFFTENFSTKAKDLKYFPFILTVFLFILSCNLIGMIPYSFTSTSHMSITFALGFSIFTGLTILGIFIHKYRFLRLFFPDGAPVQLSPLLVPIEILSYCIRGFSLPIRLFANMLAGHALLKILSGFAWKLLHADKLLYIFVSLFPLLLITAITGLELGVSCLQAFVFVVLLVVYLHDSINLH